MRVARWPFVITNPFETARSLEIISLRGKAAVPPSRYLSERGEIKNDSLVTRVAQTRWQITVQEMVASFGGARRCLAYDIKCVHLMRGCCANFTN